MFSFSQTQKERRIMLSMLSRSQAVDTVDLNSSPSALLHYITYSANSDTT